MDKKVILAVAGSGKSRLIIDELSANSKSLIFTYTEENYEQLKNRVVAKFGKIPKGIRIYTYFSFIYSYCYRPLCTHELPCKGINFDLPVRFTKKDSPKHYFDEHQRIYSARISKLLIVTEVIDEAIARLERYFDSIYIDEVQDFSANDFNFLCYLAKSNLQITLVGDYYQHTFNTSIDGNTKKGLYESMERYQNELEKGGYNIDKTSLSHSHRCSPDVCKFVTDNLGIEIYSHLTHSVKIELIEDQSKIDEIFNDSSTVKLFFQKSHLYKGNTSNWGKVKGLDNFNDVCIVLNSTSYKAYKAGKLRDLPPLTKNKLYVACTRAKGNLYFVDEKKLKGFKKV
ncbi:AAA family ATPase [Pasteurella skyensis]|uniref:AAA family ATPase n=1 Tax=Phocoenobacter skyensis TaxID=97481 RepID=A0AAJ6P0Z6_9PAST|nr:AAA family ATPase [Pasteurella skyensis]MDP8163018.1 AAA family ATPase [Pasteurella skyensis]MDP8173174.1 AAA family ATPase [Pasteurella skyensis]MDP8176396.1 AAA family ATPase [Pasteurella skyensis]MDP8178893.1 AAA family ATPase [Pasteurella skyensis]MDP8183715.1 AAA family ATPase [Pasteurella skyensis]